MAIVGAGLAVASAAVSYTSSQQQAKAQKQQIAIQKQQAEMQNLQAAREQARGRYRSQARIISAGAQGGVSGSSGVAGGVASVGSQMAGNLSYMSDMADLKAQEFGAAMKYAKASQLAGWGQTIGALGGAFSQLGSYTSKT